jgi:ABC-type uncharacterized transport system permease subunit
MFTKEQFKKNRPFIIGFLLGVVFSGLFMSFLYRSNPWLFGLVSLAFSTFTGWLWSKKGASASFRIFGILVLIIMGIIVLFLGTCAFSFQGFY